MATHAHTTTTSRRPATPPGTNGRRSLFTAAVALAMTTASATVASPANARATVARDRLATCLDRLILMERAIEWRVEVTGDIANDPDVDRLYDAMDGELRAAAAIRPACRQGFAVKARIAQQWGEWSEGERVGAALLSDLVLRGAA